MIDLNRRGLVLAAGSAITASAVGLPVLAATPQRKLGYAVVGLGGYGLGVIIPQFKNCQHSKLVALVSGDPAKARQDFDAALARIGASLSCWAAWVSSCWALPHSWRLRQAMPARYCRRASRGLACWADSMRASQGPSSASIPASNRPRAAWV